MAYQSLRQEYLQMPVVTRAYTTACVIVTIAVILFPFPIIFQSNFDSKTRTDMEVVYNISFLRTVGFNFFFNMIFTYRYCRMLEEGSFRGRTADFVMMFLFGGGCMIFFAFFVNLFFLGQAFTIMLVYVWSRRNPFVRMNFFGLLNFQAPYLPWVLLGFSVLLGNAVYVDLMGMAVGHMYYFMEDVFPNQRGGFRLLKTPHILKILFDPIVNQAPYNPLPEERPGGFDWGNEVQNEE